MPPGVLRENFFEECGPTIHLNKPSKPWVEYFCSLPHIILTVLKKSENGKGYIFRIVETCGRYEEVNMKFPPLKINHTFKINPFEIKTFLVQPVKKKFKIEEVNLIEN